MHVYGTCIYIYINVYSYETTIDTVFVCFLVDEEVNGGEYRMFASKTMKKLVGRYSKESEEMGSTLRRTLSPPHGYRVKGKKEKKKK